MKLRRQASLGFTLVELLVVVAIIGLLIGFLMPGFSRSREMAQRIRCQGNTRELVTAINHYAKDHDDSYPDREKWLRVDVSQGVRSGLIYRYLGDIKLFKCPSDRDLVQTSQSSSPASSSSRLSSYTYNGWFSGRNSNIQVDSSLAIMFVEPATQSGSGSDSGSSSTSPYFDPASAPGISDRHSGGSVLTFADGHSEFITKTKFQTDQSKLLKETASTDSQQ